MSPEPDESEVRTPRPRGGRHRARAARGRERPPVGRGRAPALVAGGLRLRLLRARPPALRRPAGRRGGVPPVPVAGPVRPAAGGRARRRDRLRGRTRRAASRTRSACRGRWPRPLSDSARQRGWWIAIVLGLFGTVWAGMGVVRAMRVSHSAAWGVPPDRARNALLASVPGLGDRHRPVRADVHRRLDPPQHRRSSACSPPSPCWRSTSSGGWRCRSGCPTATCP